MQMADMPAAERPREKLLFSGPGSLSNSELLALILRTGTNDKSAVQLADEVLAYADANAGGLGYSDVRELTNIDGIGESKACSIVAAIELSKRLMPGSSIMEGRNKISCADDVTKLLMEEMIYEKREIFMSIYLNTRLEIESKHIVSIGSLDNAPVHPREVFGPAAKRGASAVLVAHNHPSGDPTPSKMDISVTKRLNKASKIMGIRLIDHVIFGAGRTVSMREEGFIV